MATYGLGVGARVATSANRSKPHLRSDTVHVVGSVDTDRFAAADERWPWTACGRRIDHDGWRPVPDRPVTCEQCEQKRKPAPATPDDVVADVRTLNVSALRMLEVSASDGLPVTASTRVRGIVGVPFKSADALAASGLAVRRGERVFITGRGRLMLRLLDGALDYLTEDA